MRRRGLASQSGESESERRPGGGGAAVWDWGRIARRRLMR